MGKNLNTEDIKRLMVSNYRRLRNKEITEEQATRENKILSDMLKSFAEAETAQRLDALRSALVTTRDD